MHSKCNALPVSEEGMRCRYDQAHAILLGEQSTSVICNGTVFPTWIGGGNQFFYRRELINGCEFRLVNAEEARNTLAFDHNVLAGLLSEAAEKTVDPKDLPINNIYIDLNPNTVEFYAFGKVWRYKEMSQSLESINVNPKPWVISPNGKQAVFIRDYNLWLHDLQSGEERALTSDGEEYYDYGSSSTVWGRKPLPDLKTQCIWSPDGKTLFSLQKDRRQVNSLPIVHHVPEDGSLRPQLSQAKIAYPGESHVETYRLLTIDVESGKQQPLDYGSIAVTQNSNQGFFSHGHGWWGKDSCNVYFIDIDRYSQRARVVAIDINTNTSRILFEERSETHLAFSDNENILCKFHKKP